MQIAADITDILLIVTLALVTIKVFILSRRDTGFINTLKDLVERVEKNTKRCIVSETHVKELREEMDAYEVDSQWVDDMESKLNSLAAEHLAEVKARDASLVCFRRDLDQQMIRGAAIDFVTTAQNIDRRIKALESLDLSIVSVRKDLDGLIAEFYNLQSFAADLRSGMESAGRRWDERAIGVVGSAPDNGQPPKSWAADL